MTVPTKGRPVFEVKEVKKIFELADIGDDRLRMRAVQEVLVLGLRSSEARTLLLSDVIEPGKNERVGHLNVRLGNSKTDAGVRSVILDPDALQAIRRYVRNGRPEYEGNDEESLFLTERGTPFTDHGWNSMLQRFTRRCRKAGIHYVTHRHRGSRAAALQEAGWQDSQIMQVMGWESVSMLRRYIGRVPVEQLKAMPLPTRYTKAA